MSFLPLSFTVGRPPMAYCRLKVTKTTTAARVATGISATSNSDIADVLDVYNLRILGCRNPNGHPRYALVPDFRGGPSAVCVPVD